MTYLSSISCEECVHKSSIAEFEEEHAENDCLSDLNWVSKNQKEAGRTPYRQVRAASRFETGPQSYEQDASGDHERVGNKLLEEVSEHASIVAISNLPTMDGGRACQPLQ